MIGIICTSFVLCNLPEILVNVFDPNSSHHALSCVANVLWHANYSFNFVIYAASNRQYREAYSLFLRDSCCCCCGNGKKDVGDRREQVVYLAGRMVPYDADKF